MSKFHLKFLVIVCVIFVSNLFSLTSFEDAMEEGYNPRKYSNTSRFKKLYLKNHFEKTQTNKVIIPKHIHQIWIGGPIPEQFKKFAKTFEDKHPDWKYTLWTDDKVKDFSFVKCKGAFERAKSIGAKVDILRYEIIYQFGGVYLDIDFECIKPIDVLAHSHSFFTCIGGFDYVANSVIGATAKHPLLGRILNHLEHKLEKELECPWYDTGPRFFTFHVAQYLRKKPEGGIVYPIKFFHPLPNTFRFDYRKGVLTDEVIKSFFIDETFAVHYWAESWVGR